MEWAGAGEAWRLLRMIAACAWVGNPQSRTGSNKEERNHVIFAEARGFDKARTGSVRNYSRTVRLLTRQE